MMMFELRIDIFDNFNIIWSLYCEPAPLFTLQSQAPTPSIYLHTHIVLAFTVGFQTFSLGATYIPVNSYSVMVSHGMDIVLSGN